MNSHTLITQNAFSPTNLGIERAEASFAVFRLRFFSKEVGGCCPRRRCLYRAEKPFRTYMDNVVSGDQGPEAPPPAEEEAEFVPQVRHLLLIPPLHLVHLVCHSSEGACGFFSDDGSRLAFESLVACCVTTASVKQTMWSYIRICFRRRREPCTLRLDAGRDLVWRLQAEPGLSGDEYSDYEEMPETFSSAGVKAAVVGAKRKPVAAAAAKPARKEKR